MNILLTGGMGYIVSHTAVMLASAGHTVVVRDFVNAAAEEIGMKIRWEGTGIAETGIDANGKTIIAVDPKYFRLTEVESLLGDASKARLKLGFKELVCEMVREDLKLAERDELIKRHGYKTMHYNE